MTQLNEAQKLVEDLRRSLIDAADLVEHYATDDVANKVDSWRKLVQRAEEQLR